MEPRAVIEDGAIDLSPWSRRHPLDIAPRLGRLRGVGGCALISARTKNNTRPRLLPANPSQTKPAAQSSRGTPSW